MKLVERLDSKEDQSVNFIFKGDFPGTLEARYVRRTEDYLVCYLSSQSACGQQCRFCHLTATGQVVYEDASSEQIWHQAMAVLRHYDTQPRAKVIHFSFMARGEPLASKEMLNRSEYLFGGLHEFANGRDLLPRFMVSTIMPQSLEGYDLRQRFSLIHPTIYYSIYSMDPAFRKKWLPRAMDPNKALDILKDYQNFTGKIVKLHWAFIEGENDTEENVYDIVDAVKDRRLRVDVNLVRYNPFAEHLGKEPPEGRIQGLGELLRWLLPESKVKVVSRVGPDVYASCGMFTRHCVR